MLGKATLSVTPTLVWTPQGTGDRTPPLVSYIETGFAYSQVAPYPPGVSMNNPTAADGLGDPQTALTGGWVGAASYGTHVTNSAKPSGLKTRTLSGGGTIILPAGFTGGTTSEYEMGYALYPIYVTLSGQNSANQALTGQQITATLNGISALPSGTKITSYSWTFSGPTKPNPIKGWDGTNNTVQLTPWGPTDLAQTDTSGNGISISPLSFYDQAADTVKVQCVVNFTFLDGTTASVTAISVPVVFMKPAATLTALGTAVVDDPGNQRFGAGELWTNIAINVPLPFSGGTGCICQIITPVRSITRVPQNGRTTSTYYNKLNVPLGSNTWVQQGTGIDGYFPYQYELSLDAQGVPQAIFHQSGYTWDVSVSGSSADDPYQLYTTPDLDGGGNDWRTAKASDSFMDWVMYKPTSTNAIWVPLQEIVWSWNGTGTKNTGTGVWSAAGSVTTPTNGSNTNTPPQWTAIDLEVDQLHW